MKRLFTGALLAVLLFAAMLFGLGLGAQPVDAAPSLTTFGNVVSQSVVRFQTFLQPVKQATIVVSNGSTITPLGTYTPISSTANTGTSALASPAATVNNMLILHNVGSFTITLTDTGTIRAVGNVTLSPDDATSLLWTGTFWFQLAPEAAN